MSFVFLSFFSASFLSSVVFSPFPPPPFSCLFFFEYLVRFLSFLTPLSLFHPFAFLFLAQMGMWSRPSNRSETHSSPPEGSPTFLPTGSAVVASAAAGGARMGASWDKGIAAFGEAEGDGSATGAGAGVKVAPPPLLSLGDEGTSGPRTPVKQVGQEYFLRGEGGGGVMI